MSNTVSLCMICKNEKSNIGNLMEDVCPVLEEVHVTDTGSTDGTLEILKEKQKKYPNLHIHHFDWVDHFSEARNFSFTKAGNVDWIFWVDSDDRVDLKALKHFKDNILDNAGVDCWLLPYIYSKYPDGSPQTLLARERFLRKSVRPTWVGAIHEFIAIHSMRQRDYNELKIDHNRDGKFIEPKRNIKILEKEFEKNPNDPRTAYYLAKELFDHIDPRAKEKLLHFINLSCGKYWDDEIGARFRLAKQYLSENNYRLAIQTIEYVYHLDDTRCRSEFYFIYGEVEYNLKNYEIAIDWYKRCLYTPPGSPRVLNLEYWTWHPRKKIAECYRELGQFEEALEYGNKVIEMLPNDPNIGSWFNSLKSYKLHNKQGCSIVTLEFGTSLRNDSYKVNKEPYKVSIKDSQPVSVNNWKFEKTIPFLDGSLDGIVFDIDKFPKITKEELARVIKSGGFLWSTKPLDGIDVLFNDLGQVTYKGVGVYNYIRHDSDKPSIGYRYHPASMLYGGYRYRIHNLIMGAKKKGYPVFDMVRYPREVDIYVDMVMDKRFGKVNVLEFCEQLDNYSCNVENADVLNACSPVLTDYLRKKYPDKKVINVDDHFEVPDGSWL